MQQSRNELRTLRCGNISRHSPKRKVALTLQDDLNFRTSEAVLNTSDLDPEASSLQDGRELFIKEPGNPEAGSVGSGSSDNDWTPTDRQRRDLMLAHDNSGHVGVADLVRLLHRNRAQPEITNGLSTTSGVKNANLTEWQIAVRS